MAPFHEVERSFTGARIRETRHNTRSRRVFAGEPTVVGFLSGNKVRICEAGKERIIEIIPGNPEPHQVVKSQDKTKVITGTTVFTSNNFGKRISIEWREK